MTSLTFPDVNVWMALLLENHVHRPVVRKWWESPQLGIANFLRLTQLGVLRLLTTAAAMNGKPLGMREAWAAYDSLFDDDRWRSLVSRTAWRRLFGNTRASIIPRRRFGPTHGCLRLRNVAGGSVVTFDRGLAARAEHTVLLVAV